MKGIRKQDFLIVESGIKHHKNNQPNINIPHSL